MPKLENPINIYFIKIMLLLAATGNTQATKAAQEAIAYPASQIVKEPLITYFARHGSLEDVQLMLENAGVYNRFGFSALHTATLHSCEECALDIISLLAGKLGADYPTIQSQPEEMKTPHNRSALFFAARQGSKLLMQALLAAGANINHQDSKGFTPIDMLLDTARKISQANPEWPIEKSHYPETLAFLYSRGGKACRLKDDYCSLKLLRALE